MTRCLSITFGANRSSNASSTSSPPEIRRWAHRLGRSTWKSLLILISPAPSPACRRNCVDAPSIPADATGSSLTCTRNSFGIRGRTDSAREGWSRQFARPNCPRSALSAMHHGFSHGRHRSGICATISRSCSIVFSNRAGLTKQAVAPLATAASAS
jgi:hypothetical protein